MPNMGLLSKSDKNYLSLIIKKLNGNGSRKRVNGFCCWCSCKLTDKTHKLFCCEQHQFDYYWNYWNSVEYYIDNKRYAWNKGIPWGDEVKNKIRESNKGQVPTERNRQLSSLKNRGRVPWNKGIPATYEHKLHNSISNNGKTISKETRNKISNANKGRVKSEDTKNKLKEAWKTREPPNNETRNKLSIHMKNVWAKYNKEEKFQRVTNMLLSPKSKTGRISNCQMKLYEYIKIIFPTAVMDYIVNKECGGRYFLDIAIEEYKLNFEYDSIRWHKDSLFKDFVRDEYLKKEGWSVIRISEKNLKTFIN